MISTMMAGGFRVKGRPQPDYACWTLEELRALGAQLQVPNARVKTRGELLEVFDVRPAAHERTGSLAPHVY